VKKIRDESGAWIPVTYKSKRYAQWKERMKVAENLAGDAADDDDDKEEEDNDDDKNQKRRHALGMFSTQPFKYQISTAAGALHILNTRCRTVCSYLDENVIHMTALSHLFVED